ncbi:MAG: NUDIX hydrolase [Desulfobacterales bacterium]|nr:NUDIX hydrolase [Desulfobacterales bacterium]
MKYYTTLDRKLILGEDSSAWLKVENHTVKSPEGNIIDNWQWVITPDYVNVVAVTDNHTFLCFRQVKYGTGDTLAIVGGYVEPDELPLKTAQRELREETGYESEKWLNLGNFCVDPNRGVAIGHLFLACSVKKVITPINDDLEEQQLVHLTRTQLEEALMAGEFKALSWTTSIALALRYL